MLSFLEHDGIEIANSNRWIAYLKNRQALGLVGNYEILYDLYCAALDAEADPPKPAGGFSSPVTDPAPWFDPAVPASGEFLGFLATNIKGIDGVTTRNTTARVSGIGGATLGPQTTNPRVIVVNGTLLSSSCRGLEYGKRWLAGVLANEDQSCALAETHLRSCCGSGTGTQPLLPSETLLPSDGLYPSEGSTPTPDGLVVLYQSGLTAGPDEVNPDDGRMGMTCEMVDVTFTITAGNPYLYGQTNVILGPVLIADPGSLGCMSIYHWGFESGPVFYTSVTAPARFGKTGIVATISAGTGSLTGVRIFAYDDPKGAALTLLTSPTQLTGTAVLTGPGVTGPLDGNIPAGVKNLQMVEVGTIPAGSVLVYDSAKRTVRLTLADGTVEDGIAYMNLWSQALDWIEVGEGDSGTIVGAHLKTPCGANPDATVMIATQRRER